MRFFKNQDPSCAPQKLEHVENIEDVKAPPLSPGNFCVPPLSLHFARRLFLNLTYDAGIQSRSNNCLDHNRSELPKERPSEDAGDSDVCGSFQIEQRRGGAWSYNIDEIDPSVIDELPPEIQQEVRAWIRPHKRHNTVKRGSSIAHYFLPTKNT